MRYDLKYILQILQDPEHCVNFTKLFVFLQVDDDPELYEILCDSICKRIKMFTTDQILTTLVNLSHTLSPEV